MKRLLCILTIITLFNSCSKDDPIIEPEESFIEGGTIKILSLVKITNDNVIQEQYSGKIGNIDVLFYKTDEKELTFTVPNSSEIGENILEIPNLNNLKIKYDIIDTELQGTPEENISSYFTNVDNYLLTANNSNNIKNYFENLNNYFQNASEDEKIMMAKFYKANQNQFDAILNRDFLNKSSGKSSVDAGDIKILLKYVSAVLACGVGTAVAILNPEPVTKAIAAGIAIVAFDVAEDLKRDFANRNILKLNVIIDGINSDLASKSSKKSELTLYNEIEKSFALQSKSRALINSDTDSNNSNISKFFSNQNIYNSAIEKINSAISFVNDKLFFSNISLLEISSLEDSKPELTESASDLFFNNATFSIESNNLNIENIGFDNGKLNVKVKIIDESIVNEFVETKLNYSYKDDFNEIGGSFPLKIIIDPCLNSTAPEISNISQLNCPGDDNGYSIPLSFSFDFQSSSQFNPSTCNFGGTCTIKVDFKQGGPTPDNDWGEAQNSFDYEINWITQEAGNYSGSITLKKSWNSSSWSCKPTAKDNTAPKYPYRYYRISIEDACGNNSNYLYIDEGRYSRYSDYEW